MDSRTVVEVKNLTKVYHIFERPIDRVYDVFHSLNNFSRKRDFVALKDVSFSLQRGSRLAIIGQNGAGKSTLLKLISGNLTPTSGSINVNGAITALFTIGAGFHPDLTGRRNLYISLAFHGLVGKQADAVIDEIIDFTELGDFIDQPISTYSAGMRMRLAFSANTVIQPDILILDEILGVGDAYFNNKCRIKLKELTDSDKCTILLVTHDMNMAMQFCSDFIWLKRGRVSMRGKGMEVVSAYDEDTKHREEERLRKLSASSAPKKSTGNEYWGEIIQADAHPLNGKIFISQIDILVNDEEVGNVALSEDGEADNGRVNLDSKTSSWGELLAEDGKQCRTFSNAGNIFHKAPFRFVLPKNAKPEEVSLGLTIKDCATDPILIRWGSRPDEIITTAPDQLVNDGEWKKVTFPLVKPEDETDEAPVETSMGGEELGKATSMKRYGNGKVVITDVRLLDEHGDAGWVHKVMKPLVVEIGYEIKIGDTPIEAHAGLAVWNVKGIMPFTSATFYDKILTLINRKGVIRYYIDSLYLANGEYSLTISLNEREWLDSGSEEYFTTNKHVFDMWSHAFNFKVTGGNRWDVGVYRQPGKWEIRAE